MKIIFSTDEPIKINWSVKKKITDLISENLTDSDFRFCWFLIIVNSRKLFWIKFYRFLYFENLNGFEILNYNIILTHFSKKTVMRCIFLQCCLLEKIYSNYYFINKGIVCIWWRQATTYDLKDLWILDITLNEFITH